MLSVAILVIQTAVRSPIVSAQDPQNNESAADTMAADRGYRVLRTKTFLPPDFDQEVFDSLWKVWPQPLREKARHATPAKRRRMAFSRYGLMEALDNESGQGPALGYVDDGKNGWVMNCLACHAGKVAGRVIAGLPNSHFAMQTLTEDVRLTKVRLLKKPSHLDLASFKLPLGTTHGTTNSVVFGIVLGALRDRDMNVDRSRRAPKMIHHDMDAPPLWNVKKKSSLYADGFAPKNHRVLMQFMLLPVNGPKTLKSWEADFRDILAWIESLEPPKYPWPIDTELAARGGNLFNTHCGRCHGTYGDNARYEQKTIPIDVVNTDPLRLRGLPLEHRQWMRDSWLSRYGKDPVVLEPGGYVAPPLDGIWASAPYLHNGSVPTLWHMLHPDQRPTVWNRIEDGYDRQKVGLEIRIHQKVPNPRITGLHRRQYFDTKRPGKNSGGHRFPDALTEREKRAVLEYLKTL